MSSQDWFRNKKWNKNIESEFYAKLKRARTQRDQYIVIQALELAKTFPEISLKLIDEYYNNCESEVEHHRALMTKIEAYITLEDTNKVIKSYKEILNFEAKKTNQRSRAFVDFPYFVAINKLQNEYDYVVQILEKYKEECFLPLDHFLWNSAFALIKNDKNFAIEALEVADKKDSGLRYHKNLGLVGSDFKQTIEKLKSIGT